jgi:hypothetical protein
VDARQESDAEGEPARLPAVPNRVPMEHSRVPVVTSTAQMVLSLAEMYLLLCPETLPEGTSATLAVLSLARAALHLVSATHEVRKDI